MLKIAMSSGHGKFISGAVGPSPWGLHEHTEAVRVVNQTAIDLRKLGLEVVTYEDTVSHSQSENLDRLVDWHNSQTRDMDISIHFNSNGETTGARGHECWYVSDGGKVIAQAIVEAVCTSSGLTQRGVKYTDGLAFLNGTDEPACLVETCFVNAKQDCDIYRAKFTEICTAIAAGIADEDIAPVPPEPTDALLEVSGSCSWFGGPDDTGVSPSEGLAFLYEVSDAPDLFLPTQPPGTSGLARRLDPETFYVACRWDYSVTSKDMLRDQSLKALVRANGREFLARPGDWGPHEDTGRVADISPGLMAALGIDTDDQVEVIYPAPDDIAPPEPIPEPDVPVVSIQIAVTGKVRIIINGMELE